MKRNILSRIEHLEIRSWEAKPQLLRCGWLSNTLPADYTGDRHLAIIQRQPTGSPHVEWCLFEERAGPAPDENGKES